MQQFIQMATSALDTSEQVARTVTGSLLDLITRNAPQADVTALFSKLPGAADLLNAFQAAPAPPPPPPPPPDSSLLGSLTNAASAVLSAGSTVLGTGSSMLNTGASGLSSLAAVFDETGLDVTKIPQLVGMFAQWAAQQAGSDLVHRVLGSIPGVSTTQSTLGSFGVPGMGRQ
jgi:hypothetical protein